MSSTTFPFGASPSRDSNTGAEWASISPLTTSTPESVCLNVEVGVGHGGNDTARTTTACSVERPTGFDRPGTRPIRTSSSWLDSGVAHSRICSNDCRNRRDTCICETPTRSAISACESSSKKRSSTIWRSRGGRRSRRSCTSVRFSLATNPSSGDANVSLSVGAPTDRRAASRACPFGTPPTQQDPATRRRGRCRR